MAAAASARPARFRLLDDFTAGFIKFQGREPRTLEELAIALADNEHRRRLAEVKAMRSRLAQLDELLPALAARGVKVWPSSIHCHDDREHGKVLRIYPGFASSTDDKLHAALIELGFKEFERREAPRNDTVKLQHGRWLVVEIDVSKAGAA